MTTFSTARKLLKALDKQSNHEPEAIESVVTSVSNILGQEIKLQVLAPGTANEFICIYTDMQKCVRPPKFILGTERSETSEQIGPTVITTDLIWSVVPNTRFSLESM